MFNLEFLKVHRYVLLGMMVMGSSFLVVQGEPKTNIKQLTMDYETVEITEYLDHFSTLLTRVDHSSLRILNENYAVDANNAYFQDKIIPNADLETLEIYHTAATEIAIYARDKNNVYFEDRIIDKADPKSFEPIGQNNAKENYAIDKKYVYWQDKRIENADPNSFQYLTQARIKAGYSRDKSHLYFQNKIVEGIDGTTFKMLYGLSEERKPYYTGYAKDKNGVYYYKRTIPNADPESFRLLGGDLAVDKNNVYLKNKIKKEMDCITLEVLNENFLKDKYHVYYRHESKLYRLEEADAKTFKVSDGDNETLLGQDKNFAFELDGEGDYVVII